MFLPLSELALLPVESSVLAASRFDGSLQSRLAASQLRQRAAQSSAWAAAGALPDALAAWADVPVPLPQVPEADLVAGLLAALQGLPSAHFAFAGRSRPDSARDSAWDWVRRDGSRAVGPPVAIASLSAPALDALVRPWLRLASRLAWLRRLIGRMHGRAASLCYQAWAASLARRIQLLDADIARLAQDPAAYRIVALDEALWAVSGETAWLVAAVKRVLAADATCPGHARTTVGAAATAEGADAAPRPAGCSATLLSVLFEHLGAEAAHGTVGFVQLAWQLCLDTLLPYLRLMSQWVFTGRVADPFGEGPIVAPTHRAPDAQIFTLSAWHECTTRKVPHFLSDLASLVLAAGKSSRLLWAVLHTGAAHASSSSAPPTFPPNVGEGNPTEIVAAPVAAAVAPDCPWLQFLPALLAGADAAAVAVPTSEWLPRLVHAALTRMHGTNTNTHTHFLGLTIRQFLVLIRVFCFVVVHGGSGSFLAPWSPAGFVVQLVPDGCVIASQLLLQHALRQPLTAYYRAVSAALLPRLLHCPSAPSLSTEVVTPKHRPRTTAQFTAAAAATPPPPALAGAALPPRFASVGLPAPGYAAAALSALSGTSGVVLTHLARARALFFLADGELLSSFASVAFARLDESPAGKVPWLWSQPGALQALLEDALASAPSGAPFRGLTEDRQFPVVAVAVRIPGSVPDVRSSDEELAHLASASDAPAERDGQPHQAAVAALFASLGPDSDGVDPLDWLALTYHGAQGSAAALLFGPSTQAQYTAMTAWLLQVERARQALAATRFALAQARRQQPPPAKLFSPWGMFGFFSFPLRVFFPLLWFMCAVRLPAHTSCLWLGFPLL